jgi:hypothetical protein
MKKKIMKRSSLKIFLMLVLAFTSSYSREHKGAVIANELGLRAGSKAIIQWERIFKSPRKRKRFKIDQLSKEEQEALKEYLIRHAIDSDHPTVAGA